MIIFVVLVFIGGGYTLWYLNAKENEGPVTYKTESAEQRDIVLKTVATGSVLPRKEIEIKPQISGIVHELYVEAGDIVKAGDKLAKVKVIPDIVGLNNAESRVNRAKINMENAEKDYQRNKKLFESGVIASADYQQFELAKRNAAEELSAAEDNLGIVKEGVAKGSGKTTNTVVMATISGMVLDVPVEVGNSVIEANNFNDGTTIAFIADMDDLIFEGKVDESEVGKLRDGMQLILSIGAIENQKFQAVLEYISPKGVEDNGAIQFGIKAAVLVPDSMFVRAGFSANADVVLDKRDQVWSISERLIQYDRQQNAFVEIETGDNLYERKDVKLGLSDGIYVEVLDGVSPEDKIKVWNQPIRAGQEAAKPGPKRPY